MKVNEYNEWLKEVQNEAVLSGQDVNDEFINRVFSIFESEDEFSELYQFYFGKAGKRNRMMQIDGYALDESEKSISLIISDFINDSNLQFLNNTQIDALFNRMLFFLDEVCNGDISQYCDESDEVIKLSHLLKYRINSDLSGDPINKIKFYIISNKKLSYSVKKLKQADFNNKKVELNIWDIERIYDKENENNNEPITIDIKNDFDSEGIPCVRAEVGKGLNYEAYTAIINGYLLAQIYLEHGSKVLEGNVRAFLGTSGNKSVNSGIKRTIIDEPSKFFIYNNGIATTAADITLEEVNGETKIIKIEDLQIINGGQTTASLASTLLTPPKGCTKQQIIENIKNIYVPMKLTVIKDRESVDEDGIRTYDSMVQKIARYANTQNPVKAADFFSNSPYHILMEKLSKKYLAPPVNGKALPTGWYYERSRKKYQQEQIKMTESEKKRFQEKFPNKGANKQLVTKELLAKCIYCSECKPNIVAKGNNYIMKDFGNSINEKVKKDKTFINETYFKTCIAKVILFKTADKLVSNAPWYQTGGYKADIVPYTIAKIIDCIPKGLAIDWMRIWDNQAIYPSLVHEIEIVSEMTNDFILDSHGMIVTEYCKKEDTWKKYQEVSYNLTNSFYNDLINEEILKEKEKGDKKKEKVSQNISIEIEVYNVGCKNWEKMLNFGLESKLLTEMERDLLKLASNIDKTGRMPSTSQSKIILKIKDKLEEEGFRL